MSLRREAAGDTRDQPGYPDPQDMSLDEFKPMTDAGRALLAFWRCLPREPGQAPKHADCDLLEIAELLPDCMMLQFQDEITWPIRMFGTGITSRFGLDATGLNALDTFQPDERPGVKYRIGVMRNRPAILNTVSVFTKENGLRLVSEWVFTPLAIEDGTTGFGLASIAPVEHELPEDGLHLDGALDDRAMLRVNFVNF